MENFGATIKKLRLERKLPLRVIAEETKIDKAVLSKIERGQRNASREMVIAFSAFFHLDIDILLTSWLSDKLVYEISDEKLANEVLMVAEKKINYHRNIIPSKNKIIQAIKNFIKHDGRISKAWLFGSFVRNDFSLTSDIDLMVKFKNEKNISIFDLADISYLLEQITNTKIDLVEEGHLEPYAWETAKNDLILIYEQ